MSGVWDSNKSTWWENIFRSFNKQCKIKKKMPLNKSPVPNAITLMAQ